MPACAARNLFARRHARRPSHVAQRSSRARRRLTRLAPAAPAVCAINRLSDLLFVMARSLNHSQGVGDVLWRPAQKP